MSRYLKLKKAIDIIFVSPPGKGVGGTSDQQEEGSLDAQTCEGPAGIKRHTSSGPNRKDRRDKNRKSQRGRRTRTLIRDRFPQGEEKDGKVKAG